ILRGTCQVFTYKEVSMRLLMSRYKWLAIPLACIILAAVFSLFILTQFAKDNSSRSQGIDEIMPTAQTIYLHRSYALYDVWLNTSSSSFEQYRTVLIDWIAAACKVPDSEGFDI